MSTDLELQNPGLERSTRYWPRTRWELSAPASDVLLNGSSPRGAEPFKLAVLELVTRGTLQLRQVERSGLFGRRRQVSFLTRGPQAAPANVPELMAVLGLFQAQPKTIFPPDLAGLTVEDLARAARQQYGSSERYVSQQVVPTLVGRGLMQPERYKVLWLFPATRYLLTPRGQAAKTELERRLAMSRQEFPGWIQGDLPRAVAFAGLAGAALLLDQTLYPDLQHLHAQLAHLRATERPVPADDSPSSEFSLDLELSEFELGGLSFSLDLTAFDSLGEAFSVIDAGVDSGGEGGDGGGDGGGD